MRIKVLIIVENLPVPFDTRVWKQALALQKHGYDVLIICPAGGDFKKKYEVLDGVHIYRHPMPKDRSGKLNYLAEYLLAFLCEFFLSCWIFLKHRFHIIQGCNPPDNLFLIALFFKMFGVKFIFDHHDVSPELYYAKFGRKGRFYKLLLWLEKVSFIFSDVVMTTNITYRNIAISRGNLSRKDVFVVRNGPEAKKFRPVKAVPKLKYGKRYLVGYVGSMSVQDGLDTLLEVALHIKNKGRKDIHFTCVGGGSDLDRLKEMKDKMGLSGMFNFTGRIADSELLRILSTADVCVNPDKPNEMNDMSTMIKIMEYMALGKAIVQFDLREGRFSAQKASLYAEHNNVADFSEKILWLLDHPNERRKMGEFGRKRIRDQLAWEYSIPNLIAAYDRALEQGSEIAKTDATLLGRIEH